MSKRKAELLFQDILEAIGKIEGYIKNYTQKQFEEDDKTADAVVRNLEIIGEATNRIPVEEREKYTGIEWTKIIGLRHRIVHDYFGIDLEIIWAILQNDLPTLKTALQHIKI